MSFIDELKAKVKSSMKTIVLPESTDIRVLEAARKVTDEGFAKVVLIGNREELQGIAGDINISDIEVVDPATSEKTAEYANAFYELRKAKGMTIEKAEETMKHTIYFGTMMVKKGDADGEIAGACNATSSVLRPAFQIVKTAPGVSVVSGMFIMVLKDNTLGEDGVMTFADCAVCPDPTAEELAQIAISTAETTKALVGFDPRVAMLSFSTKGSAKHERIDKVIEATRIAKERCPEVMLDGEMQLDAAIVPEVGASKAPGSPVAGKANVLVFPSLEAGNIGYKLVQRFAGATAIGPILQGLAAPINDLSRGCSAEDIYLTVAVAAVQSIQLKSKQ